MIRAHWIRLAIFAIAGGLLALGISLIAPKKYEGFVQILIDQKPLAGVADDPIGKTIKDLVEFARSRSVQTQVEQLTSYEVLTLAGQAAWREAGSPADKEDEFLAQNLNENVSVEAQIGSDNITARVRMSDPKFARLVAFHMYQELENQNRKLARDFTDRAVQRLDTDATKARTTLKDLDTKLRTAREKYGAPNLDQAIQSQIQLLGSFKQARDMADVEYMGALSQVQSLQLELDKTPKTIQGSVNDEVVVNLEAQLAAARTEQKTLSARYMPEHENMLAVTAKIKQLEVELEKAKSGRTGSSTTVPNPLYQSLLAKVAETRGSIDSLKARLEEASKKVIEQETAINAFPAAQEEITELLRQQEIQARINNSYTAQLDTLRNAEQATIALTSLITPASVYPEPVSPKIPINVIIGVILGLVLGVLSMLGTEAKKQPIRSLSQLNNLSLHPVYRMVPELRVPFRGLEKAPPESFETLLVNCLSSEKRPYRVGVVGITKDSGASTAALNYAVAAERHGLVSTIVSVDPKSTIKRYLWRSGTVPQGDVVKVDESIQWIPFKGASILAGQGGHTAIRPEVSHFERDVTIFDFEPTTESAEYAFAASHLDEVILMVRADKTRSVDFLGAQQALRDAGAKMVTVVLSRGNDLSVMTDSVEQEPDFGAKPLTT